MKKLLFVALVLVFASLLGGCQTARDIGSVFDRPATAAVVGAVVGNEIGGTTGAILGGVTGYAVGKARQERMRTFVDAQTKCRVSQTGYYESETSFVVTKETRVCDSKVTNPGFRTNPDNPGQDRTGVTTRYETGGSAPQTAPSTGRCRRYNADGTVNTGCR